MRDPLRTDLEMWRVESMGSIFYRHSPHYQYHGAIQSLDSLVAAFDLRDISPTRRYAISIDVLNGLQNRGPFTVEIADDGIVVKFYDGQEVY